MAKKMETVPVSRLLVGDVVRTPTFIMGYANARAKKKSRIPVSKYLGLSKSDVPRAMVVRYWKWEDGETELEGFLDSGKIVVLRAHTRDYPKTVSRWKMHDNTAGKASY